MADGLKRHNTIRSKLSAAHIMMVTPRCITIILRSMLPTINVAMPGSSCKIIGSPLCLDKNPSMSMNKPIWEIQGNWLPLCLLLPNKSNPSDLRWGLEKSNQDCHYVLLKRSQCPPLLCLHNFRTPLQVAVNMILGFSCLMTLLSRRTPSVPPPRAPIQYKKIHARTHILQLIYTRTTWLINRHAHTYIHIHFWSINSSAHTHAPKTVYSSDYKQTYDPPHTDLT